MTAPFKSTSNTLLEPPAGRNITSPPPQTKHSVLDGERGRKLSASSFQLRDDSPMSERVITVGSPSTASSNTITAVYTKQGSQTIPLSAADFRALTGKEFTPRLIIAKTTDRPDSPFQRRSSLLPPLEEFVFSLWKTNQNPPDLYLEQTADSSFYIRAKETIPQGSLICELSGEIKKTRLEEQGFEHISTQNFAGISTFIPQGFPNCTIVSCFSADKTEHFFLVSSEEIQANKVLCCNWGRSFQDTLYLPYKEPRLDEMFAYFANMDLLAHIAELSTLFEKGDEVYVNRIERGKELFKQQTALTKLHYLLSQPAAFFSLLSRLEESYSSRRKSSSLSPSKDPFSAKRVLDSLLDRKILSILSINTALIQQEVLHIASFFNVLQVLLEISPSVNTGLLRFCREEIAKQPTKILFSLITKISEVIASLLNEKELPPNPQAFEEKLALAIGNNNWEEVKPLLYQFLSEETVEISLFFGLLSTLSSPYITKNLEEFYKAEIKPLPKEQGIPLLKKICKLLSNHIEEEFLENPQTFEEKFSSALNQENWEALEPLLKQLLLSKV